MPREGSSIISTNGGATVRLSTSISFCARCAIADRHRPASRATGLTAPAFRCDRRSSKTPLPGQRRPLSGQPTGSICTLGLRVAGSSRRPGAGANSRPMIRNRHPHRLKAPKQNARGARLLRTPLAADLLSAATGGQLPPPYRCWSSIPGTRTPPISAARMVLRSRPK